MGRQQAPAGSDDAELNQGTIYPLSCGLSVTAGPVVPGKTENNREAKYYTITRAGLKALNQETERWR
jgi:hypothetical protein